MHQDRFTFTLFSEFSMIKNKLLRKMSFLIVLLAFTTITTPNCEAKRKIFGRRHPVKRQNFPVYGSYKYSHYNYLYPKYIGGFNARYFDSIGIPSGDIGLRGNGIYMTPW